MMSESLDRREWLRVMVGAGIALTSIAARRSAPSAHTAKQPITIYKDPSCGCCKKWVPHLEANGFAPTAHDRNDMSALKDSLGVPSALRSCHTAVVGKLIIEGHVPAKDIQKALARIPKGVLGLAVPGMPSGSPGMETGGKPDRYDVIAFDAQGATKVFATHS